MKILITAGGTSEPIDDVRRITNTSTGRLGVAISEAFLAAAPETKIIYLCGDRAAQPSNPRCQVQTIDSVATLEQTLNTLLTTESFDAVIHSMAVSDYRANHVHTPTALAQQLALGIEKKAQTQDLPVASDVFRWEQLLTELLAQPTTHQKAAGKMSSQAAVVYVELTKTPKIIQQIKQLQPSTLLVGFKLLSNVSEEELLTVAQKLLITNHCDLVLANDLGTIQQQQHHGLLVDQQGIVARANTKEEIAQVICQQVTQSLERRNGS